MMSKLIYKIEMLSDWHCGSGLSAGADVDLLCIKDTHGFTFNPGKILNKLPAISETIELDFPFIPGKTLKGLLKEAAEVIFGNDSDFYKKCFGSELKITESDGHNSNCNGECYFSNAELSMAVKKELTSSKLLLDVNKELTAPQLLLAVKKELTASTQCLFRKISSTAIDDNGVAKKHSLRKIEVAVPVTLYAEISDVADSYRENFTKCFKYIKRLGSNRNRGMGRCVIEEVK